jgi:non-ribosomal peptide synthetase component F
VTESKLGEAGNYPVSLYVQPNLAELRLRISYHWTRVSREAVRSLLEHMVALLRGLVAQPEARLGDLSLLSPEARLELLQAGRGEEVAEPATTIHRLFEEQAARRPEAVAVETVRGPHLRRAGGAPAAPAGYLRALGAGPGIDRRPAPSAR